jgi:hypothetical protein
MRQAILATALALAACSAEPAEAPERTQTVDRPLREPAPEGPQRVYSVESVVAACKDGKLKILAGVSTNSGGWSEPTLRRLDLVNGVASYEVIAVGPGNGPVSMMLQMFMVQHEDTETAGISTVRILAAQNEMTAPASGCGAVKG